MEADVSGASGQMWSSYKGYTVDDLAYRGEERRSSLRNAPGSWQTSYDPEVSESGN